MKPLILALGLLTGWALTPAAWVGSGCPIGSATVTALAVGSNGDSQSISGPFVLPMATVSLDFPNLYAQSYTVRATTRYTDGRVFSSDPVSVTGTVPMPPVPTVTPTPTPTGTPNPNQSPDCTKSATVTDATGAVWTIDAATSNTLNNGVWVGNGKGTTYKFVTSVVYVRGTDGSWYRWNNAWQQFGVEPSCGTTPTPTPTVTPTPTPTPPPNDPTAALARLEAAMARLEASHLPVLVVPPTCPATVASVQAPYANGDWRFTVRATNCLNAPVNGKVIQVIK